MLLVKLLGSEVIRLMNVMQVKNVIGRTDCADYVYSGLFCSEPIMSKDDHGNMIDNYIIFSRSEDNLQISAPQCVFGIYTDKEKTAYINDVISDDFKDHLYSEKLESDDVIRSSHDLYMELFPMVRDMYQLNDNIDSSLVIKYVDALRNISGDTLFDFYNKLFPSFFNWAKSLI